MTRVAANPSDEAALDWVIRVRDPAFADWDDLTAWLEDDRRHAEAFDRLSLADETVAAELSASPVAGPTPAPPGRTAVAGTRRRAGRRRPQWRPPMWAPAAAAAACAAVVFAIWGPPGVFGQGEVVQAPADQALAAPWGERGEVVVAAGGRLVFDRRAPGLARLERGAATFHIRHDPVHPVIVEVGEAKVIDLGTVFRLARTTDGLDLVVDEGRVSYQGQGRQVDVAAGARLTAAGDQVKVAAAEPRPQAGPVRLSWSGATLARVAADLSRSGVLQVAADPSVASRTFTGTVALDGDPAAVRRRLALVLGVRLRPAGAGWIMTSSSKGGRAEAR